MDKVQHHTVSLLCDPHTAFEMFTQNENLVKWLTVEANVEAKLGGKYELFWNPADRKIDSTIGCRITSFLPDTLLGFDWKGPGKYKELMNGVDPLTHVSVFFLPVEANGARRTVIHLIHSGWRSAPEWEGAWDYFTTAWALSFNRLKQLVDNDRTSQACHETGAQ
jgi:uncharacterized protein YndB with AHSA1/START domain